MQPLVKGESNKPQAPAAGRFGIEPGGVELRAYRPLGCPSLEQFEARFLLADERKDSLKTA